MSGTKCPGIEIMDHDSTRKDCHMIFRPDHPPVTCTIIIFFLLEVGLTVCASHLSKLTVLEVWTHRRFGLLSYLSYLILPYLGGC